MKIKLLFTFVFLTLLVNISHSQTYIPLLNNASWNIAVATFTGQYNFVINPGVDVVIGPYTYKKIFDPTTNTDVYLREDIASKKVYRNVNGTDNILYDFNLQVSNSITLGNGSTYTVIAITNVDVNGGTRRRFTLDNGFFTESWIEGVGSSRHPLKPTYELLSDPYIYLTCSAQNGVNIYNHGIANNQPTPTDCSMLLSVDEINNQVNKIGFAPNPFKTELLVSSKFDLENATLKIFNSIGQLVKEVNNLNGRNANIKRENLNSGIYFVQLIENGKLISTDKIIISD